MPDIPAKSKFQPWPEDAPVFPAETTTQTVRVGGKFGTSFSPPVALKRSSTKLIGLYESGFAGATFQPDLKAAMLDEEQARSGYRTFSDVAHANKFADSFAGKLVVPYIWEIIFWPGCLPGAAQERGDCVSHAASGAQRTTIAGDIAAMLPDQASGKFEWIPTVDPIGIRNGVTSSEFQYWFRGYNGDGWDCPTSAQVSLKYGCALRNKFGPIDLTDYSGSLAGRYGARRPPQEIIDIGAPHKLHGVVDANTFEELRDACGSLRGINTCGGQGWSSKRDQYGFSRRTTSWSHGFKVSAADDRPKIKKIFGQPLLLGNNNWGVWNSGSRDIFESAEEVPAIQALVNAVCGYHVDLVACDVVNPKTGNLMIPPGCWWGLWSDFKNRDYSVYAGIQGWNRPLLKDYGNTFLG